MRVCLKLAIAALVATAALAALVGMASARNLSISNQNIRVAFSSVEMGNETVLVRCGVTLEGSFHSGTIPKVAGSLVGYVTRVVMRRPCSGGTAWAYNGVEADETRAERPVFSNTLPWHLTYEGFGGTLPNITSARVLLTGSRFRVRAPIFGIPVNCDYTSSISENVTGSASRNTTTGVIDNLISSGTIRSSSGGSCPTGSFSNRTEDGIITLLGTATKLTLTLI